MVATQKTSVVKLQWKSYFLCFESFFRWLLAVGREEEAKEIVKKFVKSNKRAFNEKKWKLMTETEKLKVPQLLY